MPKNVKIKSSPPPRFGLVMIRTEKEASATKRLAFQLMDKVAKGKKIDAGVIFKSAVPRNRYGPSIAAIRDELSRIRVVLQYLLAQGTESPVWKDKSVLPESDGWYYVQLADKQVSIRYYDGAWWFLSVEGVYANTSFESWLFI